MNRDSYLDVQILKDSILSELHARLATAVHFCNSTGCALGITYPDFQDNVPHMFGYTVRVFGTAPELEKVVAHVNGLAEYDLISVSAIKPVPKTDKMVVFARDRQAEGLSPSSQKRRERRAAKRGVECFHPEGLGHVPHSLIMQSKSKSKHFILPIRKADTPMDGGHSYGLGYMLPDF